MMVIFLGNEEFSELDGKKLINIEEELIHYLKNVLRIRKKEKLIICDKNNTPNNYQYYYCKFNKFEKNKIEVSILEKKEEKKNFPLIDMLIVPLKSRYFEDSIEHICQLPINSIFLIKSKFISTDFKKTTEKIDRLRKISYWNSIYIRKPFITKIDFFDIKLSELLTTINYDRFILFDPRTDQEINCGLDLKGKKICLIIGPEGGWSKEEIEFFQKQKNTLILKFKNIDFGIKAEIAPIVAISQILLISS